MFQTKLKNRMFETFLLRNYNKCSEHQLIIDELNRRKNLFQDYNGSLEFYNTHSNEQLPLICMVINAFDVPILSYGIISFTFWEIVLGIFTVSRVIPGASITI